MKFTTKQTNNNLLVVFLDGKKTKYSASMSVVTSEHILAIESATDWDSFFKAYDSIPSGR